MYIPTVSQISVQKTPPRRCADQLVEIVVAIGAIAAVGAVIGMGCICVRNDRIQLRDPSEALSFVRDLAELLGAILKV